MPNEVEYPGQQTVIMIEQRYFASFLVVDFDLGSGHKERQEGAPGRIYSSRIRPMAGSGSS